MNEGRSPTETCQDVNLSEVRGVYPSRLERIRKIDAKVKELKAKKRQLLSGKPNHEEKRGKLYRLVVLRFLWFKIAFIRQARQRPRPLEQTVELVNREG